MKKKIIIIGTIITIIAVIIGLLAFRAWYFVDDEEIVLITDTKNETNDEYNSSIKKDLECTLNSLINSRFSNDFYYMNIYGYRLSNINATEFDKLVASEVSFTVKNIETEKNEAIAKIEMEYPDLTRDLNALQTYKYNDIIKNAAKTKKEFDVYLLKSDDHWFLLENNDLRDVFSGGLSSVYSNSEKEAYNQLLDLLEGSN